VDSSGFHLNPSRTGRAHESTEYMSVSWPSLVDGMAHQSKACYVWLSTSWFPASKSDVNWAGSAGKSINHQK